MFHSHSHKTGSGGEMSGHEKVHEMPIHDLAKWLLDHNRAMSKEFSSPDAKGLRLQYRAKHPTEILALKCMDGRLNLPVMTHTPVGIIQPLRNLGGRFDLGWPFLGEVVTNWVMYAMGRGRDCIILVTYHWSKGEKHRGCRGFNYEVDNARSYTEELARQIERMYGVNHSTVYPVRVGVETDDDALVFHGVNGKTLEVASLRDVSEDSVRAQLRELYPDMKRQMIEDLLPLIIGNAIHIADVRSAGREQVDSEHRERILGIGRGFDWLHQLNLALLVGPFDPNLNGPIATAAGLLLGNINDRRVPDDGIILLSSAPYREEAGYDMPRAVEKARFLSRFSLEVIGTSVPSLREMVVPITGIVNINTREFQPVQ